MTDRKPPKKHFANNPIGSLFLSFLNIKYRKISTGVIEAVNKVIGYILINGKLKNTKNKIISNTRIIEI